MYVRKSAGRIRVLGSGSWLYVCSKKCPGCKLSARTLHPVRAARRCLHVHQVRQPSHLSPPIPPADALPLIAQEFRRVLLRACTTSFFPALRCCSRGLLFSRCVYDASCLVRVYACSFSLGSAWWRGAGWRQRCRSEWWR